VRRLVATDLGLGFPGTPNVIWTPLDFGWSLADVLKKAKKPLGVEPAASPKRRDSLHSTDSALTDSSQIPWMEVGTWSNEVARTNEFLTQNSGISFDPQQVIEIFQIFKVNAYL